MHLEKHSFEIAGRLFESHYGVYVLQVNFRGRKSYHVGYGSDTTRVNTVPVLSKICQHMRKFQTRDTNVLYEALRRHYLPLDQRNRDLDASARDAMEQILHEFDFKVFTYSTDPFSFLLEDKNKHKKVLAGNREFAARIMHALIERGNKLLNKQVLNIQHPFSKKYDEALLVVLQDLELE